MYTSPRNQDNQTEQALLMALSKGPAKWDGTKGSDQVVCGGSLYHSSILESLIAKRQVIPFGTRTFVLNPNR